MAHECPECGSICYCKGDIDDSVNNFSSDIDQCNHCEEHEEEEERDNGIAPYNPCKGCDGSPDDCKGCSVTEDE